MGFPVRIFTLKMTFGLNMPEYYKSLAELYRKNDAVAFYELANILTKYGYKDQAFDYYSKAASEGHAGALFVYGKYYLEVKSIPEEYLAFLPSSSFFRERGISMIREAAAQGHKEAQELLDSLNEE